MIHSLRDELLAVAGVASAEVDAEGDAPSGVRVRLLPDADAERVGAEVQRVLASHGMRSRIAADGAATGAPEAPPRPAVPLSAASGTVAGPAGDTARSPMPAAPARLGSDTERPFAAAAEAPAGGVLASLSLEESADGVSVTAISTEGKRFTRRAAAITDDAVAGAVVAAVGALAEGRPQRLLRVTTETVEGTTVVTVLVEKADGSRLAGAAVVRVSAAYAVARATWMALRG